MRSKKHLGWYGGSCHIGKNFKCDSEATTKKDCRSNNFTYLKPKSRVNKLLNKMQNKKARQFNYLELEDIEDIPFYMSL